MASPSIRAASRRANASASTGANSPAAWPSRTISPMVVRQRRSMAARSLATSGSRGALAHRSSHSTHSSKSSSASPTEHEQRTSSTSRSRALDISATASAVWA